MRTLIGKNGLVERVMALSGQEMLRASAQEAARYWTHKPYLLNGEAVPAFETVSIVY